VNEPTASRLVSWHNIAWTFHLVDGMRQAIHDGRFDTFRRRILDVWG
jgi:queuine tRNA-ribosyltransferase